MDEATIIFCDMLPRKAGKPPAYVIETTKEGLIALLSTRVFLMGSAELTADRIRIEDESLAAKKPKFGIYVDGRLVGWSDRPFEELKTTSEKGDRFDVHTM